jgi:glycine hydroxymethyltransferase
MLDTDSMAARLKAILDDEIARQQRNLCLIASENYVSARVMNALASPFTNKYSEGEPFHRYYQGNQYVDELEALLNDLIFCAFSLDKGNWHVNAKAVSAGIANFAVLNSVLRPGDKILSMSLYDGGHLSHGWDMPDKRGVTIASRIFDVTRYHVDRRTETINYDELEVLTRECQPKVVITGGTAYPREIDHKRVSEIARSINAFYFADIAHEAGLVVGHGNATPFPYADLVSMSTQKTLRGPRGSIVICRRDLADLVDRSIFPGLQGGPFVHHMFALATAVHEALSEGFTEYVRAVLLNAKRLEDNLRSASIRLVSGGTDKHLLLLDFRDRHFSGKQVAVALERGGLITNYNTVPFDPRKPLNPSGVRIGTPALTTRGMGIAEMDRVSEYMCEIVRDPSAESVQTAVREEVRSLCAKFPLWY